METILIVDDQQPVRQVLVRLLENEGYSCIAAEDSDQARRLLLVHDVVLVLCDVNMPGESGLSLIRDVLAEHPETAAIMVSGFDDPALVHTALEYGAYGYITKTPFKSSEIIIGVANALRRRRLEIESRANRESLEEGIQQTTAALDAAQEETIRRLAAAVDARDISTGRHIERMSAICGLLAHKLGLGFDHCELIRAASSLHDVGKIAVSDEILRKPGELTVEERARMERHADVGHQLLTGSDSELLELAATIAWSHHENFDGTGYPRGLVGDEIPLAGRIGAVADVFDALTQERPYRKAMSVDEAMELMREGRGVRFDPVVLDVLLEAVAGFQEPPGRAESAAVLTELTSGNARELRSVASSDRTAEGRSVSG